MDRGKHRILVVDDEPANLELVVRILRRRYEVRTASSGAEGLELLRRERFAAILSDQRMPGMSGTVFLAEASRLVPDTVRMILTGFSPEQESLDAINLAHVSSFLTKPIAPDAVEQAVSDAVGVYELGQRHHGLVRELEEKNRELAEAKRLLESSLDERTRALLEANTRLEALALRDPLTGLYNHRYFQERLGEEIARLQRYGGHLSLVLADIDRFREFNEAHGYQAGDRAIVQIAEVFAGGTRIADLIARIRPTDMVARYGGEEFAVIVPSTPKAGARTMCERIQSSVATAAWPGLGPDVHLSLSFGIAEMPGDAESKQHLLDAAETALVRAKRGGRDRIETF